jgi:hypothetical protein
MLKPLETDSPPLVLHLSQKEKLAMMTALTLTLQFAPEHERPIVRRLLDAIVSSYHD